MLKVIIWSIIGIIMFLYLFACCKAGSDADDWMDEKFNNKNDENRKE